MLTDEQLVRAYKEGDGAALQTLIERYVRPVYNFVHRYISQTGDAEDITQDVFISVWKNIHTFDEKRSFKTWLFTIARNASLNWIKKKKPALFTALQNERGENLFLDSLADASPLPDEVFERKNFSQKIADAVDKLHPSYKEVLAMYYNEGFNFREIAETSNDSINTIKSRHRRAIAALKKLLRL